MRKIIISILLAVSIICGVIPVFAAQKDFNDVSPSDWYYDTVKTMVNKGLIDGYDDNTFKPQQSISRVEYAKIMFSAVPMDETIEPIPDNVKNEYRAGHSNYWGTEIIIEAIERSIGRFGVTLEEWEKPITRDEMAYITYASCETSNYDSKLTFYQDIGDYIGDYGDCLANDYCLSILIMFSSGIVAGTNENRDYNPKDNASRAEACAIINRVIDFDSRISVGGEAQVIHPNAPHFNSYIAQSFSSDEHKEYDTAAVDYSYLAATEAGSLTSSKYGSMTAQEAAEVKEVIDEFVSNYIRDNMSDLRKACIAAEFVAHSCNYGSDDAPRAYTAWGALVGHAAWCTGYSYAYKLLCDSIGIGCVVIPANEEASNPSHMWNAVEIDGYWYIIDVQTMDLAREFALDYGMDFYYGQSDPNFLVSAATYMNRNGMKWDTDDYPICNYNYFED